MKNVYQNQDVAHRWANGVDREIRNPGRTVFTSYDGQTIYSYGHHFPMATRITPELFLVNPNRYSVTTAKHQSYVFRAIPSWVGIVRVDPRAWTAIKDKRGLDVARHYRGLIDAAWKSANRKGLTATSRVGECAKIGRLMDDWRLLHRVAGFRCRLDAVDFPKNYAATVAPWNERAREIAAAKSARDAEKSAADARRRAARAEELTPVYAGMAAAWESGGPISHKHAVYGFLSLADEDSALLRVDPKDAERVETTHGAAVSVEDARRLWDALPTLTPDVRVPIRVGPYHGVMVRSDGVVQVGCHSFDAEAVESFAKRMGWTREPARTGGPWGADPDTHNYNDGGDGNG